MPQREGSPSKVAPHPDLPGDTSGKAHVYGAFPGPRLDWPSSLLCEHRVIVLKGTPLHEKAGSYPKGGVIYYVTLLRRRNISQI